MITLLRLCLVTCVLLAASPIARTQRVGLFDHDSTTMLASFDLAAGDLEVASLYSVADDIPEQRAALKLFYDSTGGPNWSTLFNNSAALDAYVTLEAGLPATGI